MYFAMVIQSMSRLVYLLLISRFRKEVNASARVICLMKCLMGVAIAKRLKYNVVLSWSLMMKFRADEFNEFLAIWSTFSLYASPECALTLINFTNNPRVIMI